jgi:hypothetical protein
VIYSTEIEGQVSLKIMSEKRVNTPLGNLKTLIERVNLIPSWVETPFITHLSFEKKILVMREFFQQLTKLSVELSSKNKERRRGERFDTLDIEERFYQFKQHILGNVELLKTFESKEDNAKIAESQSKALIYHAITRYEDFVILRGNMKSFAGIRKKYIDLNANLSVNRDVFLFIDEKGRLQFHTDELLDALKGVEIDRLAECEVCNKLFWKGRKNVVCCDLKCSNVLNNRKARNAYRSNPIKYKLRKSKS